MLNLEPLSSNSLHKQFAAWAAALLPIAMMVFLVGALGTCAGCSKAPPGSLVQGKMVSSGDPQVDANLTMLSEELKFTLRRDYRKTHFKQNFDEFTNLRSDLTVPPPPAGKKYAISKDWRVILVAK